MKKTLNLILIFSVILSIFTPFYSVSAAEETRIGTVNVSDVLNVRAGPGTNHDVVGKLSGGYEFVIKGESTDQGGCSGNIWYELEYNGSSAFVCSSYVLIRTVNPEEVSGEFPDSYKPKLEILQGMYPEWTFIPYYTGIKWSDFIQGQNSLGKSLINYGSLTANEGCRHLDGYNFKTNIFRNNYSGGGSLWFAASDQTIGYFGDPRNFLDPVGIFQFEKLSYDKDIHTLEGVQSMLNGTFMEGKPIIAQADRDRDLTFAQIFIKAAETHNISPYFLVSRIIQEVGRGVPTRNVMVRGDYPDYEELFNFYNIGATGSSISSEIIVNGLTRARNEGWNNEHDSIIGGAGFNAGSYLDRGQDTHYYQKFNVVTPTYFAHQYMQNIRAPRSEAGTVYTAYKNNNQLQNPFVFSIPIFSEMPAETKLPHPGNPNNWLSDLKINGVTVVGFDPERYEYQITVAGSKANIEAARYVNKGSISGLGELSLDQEITKKDIVVTAENLTKRTYKLEIIRFEDGSMTVRDLVRESVYENDEKYLKKINIETSIENFVSKFREHSLAAEIVVKNANGALKEAGNIATGDEITIKLGSDTVNYQAVVLGDTNGDGKISIVDLLRVQRIILKDSNLSEVYTKAADLNSDGKINIVDLLRVQKHIIGG